MKDSRNKAKNHLSAPSNIQLGCPFAYFLVCLLVSFLVCLPSFGQSVHSTSRTQLSPNSSSVSAQASTKASSKALQPKAIQSKVSLSKSSPPLRSAVNIPLTPDEEVNVKVYKLANRSVVNIAKITDQDVLYNVEPQSGTASGTIISTDGYILTNFHVIEQASQIRVTLFDGTMLRAELVGQDPSNDLAVIKINPPAGRKLTTLPFGDSSRLEVGCRVFAIGNPFGLDRSMTTGIVSSLARTYRTENNRLVKGVIQTDAAINPGNSGGPLLDTSGQMIGITSAILSRAGQSAGIGLAIPINIAKKMRKVC